MEENRDLFQVIIKNMQDSYHPGRSLEQRLESDHALKNVMRKLGDELRDRLIAGKVLTRVSSFRLDWDSKYKDVMLGRGFVIKVHLRDAVLEYSIKLKDENNDVLLPDLCHVLAPDIKCSLNEIFREPVSNLL